MISSPTIYRIDKSHRELKSIETPLDLILWIIDSYFVKLGSKLRVKKTDINSYSIDKVIYYLYAVNTEERESEWFDFLPLELTESKNFIQQRISLLLFAEVGKELFVVIGGNSYKMVIPYLDKSYGLNTYARIMDSQKDELVTIRTRGLTGTRAGMSEQFRGDFRIIDFIKFGKVPEEIHVLLSTSTTNNHFSFLTTKQKRRLNISVGRGFKVKRALDFAMLHDVIVELNYIGDLVASDYLSSYKEIRDPLFIENNLRSVLIGKLFDDIPHVLGTTRESVNRFHFDFCNPNSIEKFYEADYYTLLEKTENDGHRQFDKVLDREDIYSTVIKRAVNYHQYSNRFEFMVYLQGVRVNCYREGKKTTGSSFLFHFTTEIRANNRSYFLVDTKWYSLRDSFVDDLKNTTKRLFESYKLPSHILRYNWDKKSISREGDYNLLYNGQIDFIVGDTILVDGIEIFDILYIEGNTLYLVHVKYGFGSSIRELTNQILISARRLRESLASGNLEVLEKLYQKLVSKGRHINGLSKQDFKDLFKKRIVYVFAMASHLSEDFLVDENIDLYESNIARYSLVQCSSEMRANYYDMMVCQIPRR